MNNSPLRYNPVDQFLQLIIPANHPSRRQFDTSVACRERSTPKWCASICQHANTWTSPGYHPPIRWCGSPIRISLREDKSNILVTLSIIEIRQARQHQRCRCRRHSWPTTCSTPPKASTKGIARSGIGMISRISITAISADMLCLEDLSEDSESSHNIAYRGRRLTNLVFACLSSYHDLKD